VLYLKKEHFRILPKCDCSVTQDKQIQVILNSSIIGLNQIVLFCDKTRRISLMNITLKSESMHKKFLQ